MGSIGTVVVSDRGDKYLPFCLRSLEAICIRPDHIVDDSQHELGLAGAVNAAWTYATNQGWDYLFHVEEDFLIREAPLQQMREVLEAEDDLAQVTLKRQPVWGLEVDLGDQLAAICRQPDTKHEWRPWGTRHTHLFSINPTLIPRKIFERGWPAGNEAEQSQILKDEGWWFSVWGHIGDLPRAIHIGAERSEGWRL